MPELDERKKQLRKLVRELKNNLTAEERLAKSAALWGKLEHDADFTQANTIMAYWSMQDEVHTHDFIIRWSDRKKFILPSVSGDYLILKEFKGIDLMKEGENFRIPEPLGPTFSEINKIDLIIVPGIAFDRMNNRMGRGRGYYDKFLVQTTFIKIGVCFDFQLFDEVPAGTADVKMDRIYTA